MTRLWRAVHEVPPANRSLLTLDQHLDCRLVQTFLATLAAIVEFRNRAHGLLLSELGAYLLGPQHAPAGTKRLSNLLRSAKWTHALVDTFLWQQAQARLDALGAAGADGLLLWDESVIEKPESQALEDLCAVRSSKAKRLTRLKPGYWHPPTKKPIFVPGMAWIGLLLVGRSGPPCVAAMRWWSSRGENKSSARQEQEKLLEQVAQQWGRRVVHGFDRGYAGGPWLSLLLAHHLRGLVRWPNGWYLHDATGKARKAWQIVQGKRAVEQRLIWDARRQVHRTMGVLWTQVTHPEHPDTPLWLVVSRPGKGLPPWYLLTTEEIKSADDAWKVIFAYARRWQIETAFRYTKSELAFESPRLWSWEGRQKLLLMATLVYAFLLTFLDDNLQAVKQWLLRHGCHRTGKRGQQAAAPLYRLRSALSCLWRQFIPEPARLRWQTPG